jgi:hypothetical protein
MKNFRKFIGNNVSLAVTFVLLIAAVPVLMGAQNWDDHNRSAPLYCQGYRSELSEIVCA